MLHKGRKKWVLIGALFLGGAIGLYYIDLLRAAVTLNPIPRSAQSINRGQELFQRHCAVCHGIEGHGDGVAAATLPEHPEDLSKIAPTPYFPDGVVAFRIANGGNVMPAWKAVLGRDDIWDLINFIRSLHE